MAIEVCVDIANHVIADRGLRVPTTYAEAFEVLSETGLLDAALRDAMIRMSQFPAIVVRILREQLGDFARFRAAVLGWL